MNEAQVWAVISILGAAVLLLVAERFTSRLVKLWMVQALVDAFGPLIKSLAEDASARPSQEHMEVPRTSWSPRILA